MDGIIQISLAHTLVGASVIIVVQSIITWWIKTRLEQSIQHEYDQKLEVIKSLLKSSYDLSKKEKESYEEMIHSYYSCQSAIKRYEFNHKLKVDSKVIIDNEGLREEYFTFLNNASEFVGKCYVFLNEESHQNLKDAIRGESTTFNELGTNLLHAMRKSLYPNTKLDPNSDNLKEFKYPNPK